jgi:hypothetical protein
LTLLVFGSINSGWVDKVEIAAFASTILGLAPDAWLYGWVKYRMQSVGETVVTGIGPCSSIFLFALLPYKFFSFLYLTAFSLMVAATLFLCGAGVFRRRSAKYSPDKDDKKGNDKAMYVVGPGLSKFVNNPLGLRPDGNALGPDGNIILGPDGNILGLGPDGNTLQPDTKRGRSMHSKGVQGSPVRGDTGVTESGILNRRAGGGGPTPTGQLKPPGGGVEVASQTQ